MPTPVDRHLVRESRAARCHLAAAAILGAVEAGLIVAQAVLLATVIARAALAGAGIVALEGDMIALGVVLAARALVSAAFELSGRLGASRVMSELRGRLVSHLLLAAPGQRPHDVRTGELAAGAVQGVDALEAYFAGYLPQLMLASTVPVVVLVWVTRVDAVAAGILALTVPILFAFMVLIGKGTKAQTRKRLGALELLSAHFLDVVRGLPTLRAYRRERFQEQVLADVGEQYRRETMGTLRIAFLSALVLELCAMLGTAVVAATIGVQLVGGALTLQAGLTVLLLVPELYAPLRQVGQQFHASADGSAAAERIFATLETRPALAAPANPLPAPDPRSHAIELRGVSYEYPGRPGLALDSVDLELPPGSFTALVGASGSGKSTLARLLARLADPTDGAILCGGVDLRELDLDAWRARVAWVPQHPTLFTGTVAENVALAAPHASAAEVQAAIEATNLGEVIASLPNGIETRIGEAGRRLSAGQRQRIALARAFLQDAALLIVDEPTAHLDRDNAVAVGEAIECLARGRTTLLIVHDQSLAARAERILRIHAGAIGARATTPELAA
ncbi:MAG TPA: thiol reductant ABC exporter subunit CydD [Solirubrobacteraceae bacterium]|nr:thiol reductant ABC exporter subunit CydD [Solirubrobacteraceae bacterium]